MEALVAAPAPDLLTLSSLCKYPRFKRMRFNLRFSNFKMSYKSLQRKHLCSFLVSIALNHISPPPTVNISFYLTNVLDNLLTKLHLANYKMK